MHKYEIDKQALFRKTIPYVKKYRLEFLITLFLCLAISILSAITPFITKAILDDYLPQSNYKFVIIALILYGVITFVLLLSRYLFSYVSTLTGMKIEKTIREEAMAKVNRLPVDYFSFEPDGKIVAKITADSNGVRMFYATMFTIFNAVLNIIIVYIGVIVLNPILGLIVLIIVPLLLVWITFYRKWVHKYYINLKELRSRITGKLNENITGSLIIQDFNLENKISDEYKEITKEYVHYDRITAGINNTCGFELLNLIKRACEISLLMYLGFTSINVGGVVLGIGLISALVENLDKMINPFSVIFDNLNELEDSMVGAGRVYGFIDEDDDVRINDGNMIPNNIDGTIDFEHVKFAYIKDNYVIHDLSLHVDSGKTIGIVGHTGSGKSSLMNLLLGYNDYQGGSIKLDGVDITSYNKSSYRSKMGIVLQNPAIFQGTLRSNITMERNYSDNEVLKALDSVGALYLTKRTKDGLDMPISFRGENLSLGEKQLISFARILLRNPKILVLDEATANIDSETEIKIQNAMNVVSKGRTTFIIAHRLSTIKNADEIIVLDNGLIAGRGTHKSLYESCPVYKDMYDSQFKLKK